MEGFFILLAVLIQLAIPVLFVIGIVWAVKKFSKPSTNYIVEGQVSDTTKPITSYNGVNEAQLREKIAREIRAQSAQYKTASQKKVVEEMALTVEYFTSHAYHEEQVVSSVYAPPPQSEAAFQAPAKPEPTAAAVSAYETPWKKLQVLDGAVILLYLGAFMLLAAIGLFIGLGEGTTIKAVLAILLAGGFYIGGIALYTRSKRLKPVGATFSAIGMATLPMAGYAVYYYALNQSYSSTVWFLTSIAALVLYAHALHTFRSRLVSYMIVFSSLSAVLSSVASFGLAPYYYIQGMAAAGILFVFVARFFKNRDPMVSEPYDQSAMFLVPFSVALSVLFVSQIGWLQLGISLAISAFYYVYLAMVSEATRPFYVMLAQLSVIGMVCSFAYELWANVTSVTVVVSAASLMYAIIWLVKVAWWPVGDKIRQYVKVLTLCLPVAATLLLLYDQLAYVWIGLVILVIVSVDVYVTERDSYSAPGWVIGLLLLPPAIGFLALNPAVSLSAVGVAYVVLFACAVLVKLALGSRMNELEISLQQFMLVMTAVAGSFMQIYAGDATQFITAMLITGGIALQAWREAGRSDWLLISSFVQLGWLVAFVENPPLLATYVVGVLLFNLVVSRVKGSFVVHQWLSVIASLSLPLIYGLYVVPDVWSNVHYFISYGLLMAVWLMIRQLPIGFVPQPVVFGYITSLMGAVGFSLAWGIEAGLIVSVCAAGVLLYVEKLEKEAIFGYFAPLVPVLALLQPAASSGYTALIIAIVTLISGLLAILRRRQYEILLVAFGILLLPWQVGSFVYGWSTVTFVWIYGVMSALAVLALWWARKAGARVVLLHGLRVIYVTALVFMSLYSLQGDSWQLTATGFFAAGLIATAISYAEDQPALIILAFLYGYSSLLRTTTGASMDATIAVAMFACVSQATYWLLQGSRLMTKRAEYARYTQLAVAAVLPLQGVGRPELVVYPVTLALFAAMLVKEFWQKGQNEREITLMILHFSILWMLYAAGMRELQVYTQSTALVVAAFALWRRYRQDDPSTINSYLWAAVLLFTVPLVWQAVVSANPLYAYLLVIEHVALIIVSIAYKRATFTWWGIIVVVGAVLYQMRKLRYAALAVLGIFVISLAVYFLLRFNKPDQNSK